MACEARHKAQTIVEGLHSAISFEYVDESARLAGGPFEYFDKYKIAYQEDNSSLWLLIDELTETWLEINQNATTILNDDDGYISTISDSINDAGLINLAAKADHQHAHGNRGGGSLHELATSIQAGFLSVDGYNKLEGIEDGAQVNTVDSVFGRTGTVTASSGDYNSNLIDNVSTVPGTSVSDALEYLDGYVNDGIVGGDLFGTLPNPNVVDLTIFGEQQGSILYFNGTNWVQLPPSTDGYVLTTQGIGDNPEWTSVSSIGAGDVIGPASSTDNALVRWDGLSGKFIQNSNAILTDDGYLTLTLGLTTGSNIDVGGNSIVNVNLVDGVDVSDHSSRHENGGSDEIEISSLGTSEVNTSLVLKPNGLGGVFWTADEVRDLDGYVFYTRQIIAGAGLTGGGDLSADRTLNVVANIDGSIIVNANDIQVGILATDTQHGNRGGGSLHELANSTQAGFFSIDGYNKLDGIEDGAQVNTVDSVFGRTGTVIALASDYNASQIDNDSGVPGTFVDDALDYLDGYISDIAADFESHANRHEFGGADQIDGYELELTYSPTYYVTPVNNKLGEHIAAIDNALAGAGFGDVVGPASSTDNAIVRFDGITGKLIQNSNATLTDSGALTLTLGLTVGGNIDVGNNSITNVNLVDGVDVSDHSSRHDPGGTDALTTAAAVGLNAGSTNTEGAATSFARSNHTHALDVTTGTLSTINAGDTASDGTAIGLVRRDHQHAVATTTASGLTANSTSTEGISTSLARADHTHAIDSTGTLSTINAGDTASDGTATGFSRKDHQHAVATGSASTLSGSNSEGSSTNLARADHNHALGGSVGGDLSGTLPNPTVTDLTIAGEQQGSILYFDGYGWEELSPGDDGYVLTTNGVGANPTWEEAAVVVKRIVTVEFTLTEDVNNTTQWFTTWRSHGGDSPENKRSGTTVGIQNSNSCSPYQVPFNATIIKAVLTLKGAGVQNGSVTYPVIYQTDLFEEAFTTETKIADIDFSISNAFTVGTYSVGNTNYKGSVNLNIDVDEADLLALKFINGNGASVVGQTKNAFITLIIEER